MRRFLVIVAALALGLVLFAVWGALRTPQVVHYTVPIAGIERPLRLVQLSDSHAGIDMPPSRLRQVVAMMNALHPDIIVLTGDYISGYPDSDSPPPTAALAPFAGLHAPLGVFAVLGNHDDPAHTRKVLANGPVQLLAGARVDTGPFWLVGADDLLRGSDAVEGMRRAVRSAPAGKPVVVIAHEPDFFQYLPARAALLIAGHTHGGQILLPFLGPPYIGDFGTAHRRGLFHEHAQAMVVSSGLGTSLLPLRIGVPPEIVVISLVPDHSVGKKSGTDR